MGLDDAFGNGQAQACPAPRAHLVGLVETFEYVRQFIGRDTVLQRLDQASSLLEKMA